MRKIPLFSCLIIAYSFVLTTPAFARPASARNAADFVFSNGHIFTASNQEAEAIAIKDGIIVYVGSASGSQQLIGRRTNQIDLHGRMLMPGLVDGHMHPQSAGLKMMMCNLNYDALTIEQLNSRVQACVDAEPNAGPNDWLVVINWFEQNMLPSGTVLKYQDLSSIHTNRPIYIRNSFGHAAQLNGRGMEIVSLATQAERAGGTIVRDANGQPTGRLEESAKDIVSEILPQPNEAQNLQATTMAIAAMNAQGITTILDAYTDIETMTAYKTLRTQGKLTLRPHFAVLIDPDKEPDNAKSVAEVARERAMFDEGAPTINPSLSVHTAKMFLDGVIAAPSFTGVMVEPYFTNHGTDESPHFTPGTSNGPAPYINRANLADLVTRLAEVGIDSHMHADGDGAVRLALDAIEDTKKAHPEFNLRPAIAHAEIVHPADYGRFAQTGALPVLSFQWGKPAADTIEGAKDYMGPYRHALLEPQGLLDIYGARVVFGSDWPVDPLNEWLALQVAITRAPVGEDKNKYQGRLGVDPGLSLDRALRAMTIDAAFSLRVENVVGSLEVGKFADLIILDRDLFKTPNEEIADTKVDLTMVGGKVVFERK